MVNELSNKIQIEKIGNGFYLIGTKKVYCKVLNGNLVVRVGGGYVSAEEFLATL